MFAKITAQLSSPLALSPDGVPPHLDALCEYVMSKKARSIAESKNGHRHPVSATIPGQPVERQGTLPIPIVRKWVDCGNGLRCPIPRVSQGIVEPIKQRSENYHCAFPLERAGQLKEKQRTTIATTGGPLKSFRLPLRIVDTSRVVWFAELRDKKESGRAPMSELRKILRQVHAIGKKTSQGFGTVAEWLVEPTDIDASWIYDGVLMRPLPVDLGADASHGKRRCFGAVAAPYWQADFYCDRFVPSC